MTDAAPTVKRFSRTTSGPCGAFKDAEYATAIHPHERDPLSTLDAFLCWAAVVIAAATFAVYSLGPSDAQAALDLAASTPEAIAQIKDEQREERAWAHHINKTKEGGKP